MITIQIPKGELTPRCPSCHEEVEDVLAVRLPWSGEVRMYHYLCPNGVQEIIFVETPPRSSTLTQRAS